MLFLILALVLFRIAAFLFGFFGGVCISYLFFATTPLATIAQQQAGSNWEVWIVVGIVVAIGVITGVVAAVLVRPMMILSTATTGAYMIAMSIDALFLNSRIMAIAVSVFRTGAFPDTSHSIWYLYLLLVGVVAFSVAGAFVQFRVTAHNYHHERRHEHNGYRQLVVQDDF